MLTLHSLRSLARAPGLAVTAVGMLALGTGALIAAFSLVYASLFREPPFDQPAGIVALNVTRTGPAGVARRERWSYARLQLLERLSKSYESLSNYSPTTLTVGGPGGPEMLNGEVVAPSFFHVLRVRPVLGRFFRPDEDLAPGANPLIVLSHALWLRRFQGDSAVTGKSMTVNGVPLTIIGVAPPAFQGVSDRAVFWLPTTMAPLLYYAEYLTTNQNFISVIARLRQGVSAAQANAELAVLSPQIEALAPSQRGDTRDAIGAAALTLNDARIDGATRRSVLTLLAAVALLYLLACANVANLLLARAATRRRESAIRAALGSSRARLLRFQVAEGAVVASAGGALGLAGSYVVSSMVAVPSALWPGSNLYGSIGTFDSPSFDWPVSAFGAGLTVFSALLVSAGPALSVVRSDWLRALRVSARGVTDGSGSLRRPTVRGVVVAAEAALAVLLLVSAGLMISSYERMRRADLGVDAEHVLTFLVRPSELRVPVAAAPAYIARILDAIVSVPGVVSASVDGGAPTSGSASSVLHVVGQPVVPDAQAPPVNRHYVAPSHFRTLGIRVLDGRGFTDADIAGRGKVTVVSESAARRFWPGENPLGKRVWFGGVGTWANADSSAEVVGVVSDVVHQPLDARPNRNEFYTPYAQFTYAWRVYFVKTTGSPTASAPEIRKAVLAVEPDVPLTEVRTLTELIGQSWARHRFDALLFGGFASTALLLAAVGIYSVVAYAVTQRTRELGVRLALGADPSSLVRLVVRDGLALPAAGVVAGVAMSLAATRLIRASLYEIAPTDTVVFAATVSVLLLVATLACWVPARRTTRVDPTEALRAE